MGARTSKLTLGTNVLRFQESDFLFKATFNQAAVGMAHVSLAGDWLLMNQKICDIVGYSQHELTKMTFQDLTHPEDLGNDLSYVEKMIAGEIATYSMEKRYIRKDKSIIWVNLTVSLVRTRDKTPLYFISVVEDIHQRKLMEAEFKEMHERTEKLVERRTRELTEANIALQNEMNQRKRAEKARHSFFELSNELMAVVSFDGYLKIANAAFLRCLGYTQEELTSRRIIDFIHPDDQDKTKNIAVDVKSAKDLSNFTNRYVCKDGSIKILSWNATAVPEDSCIYAIAREVSDSESFYQSGDHDKL